MSKTVKFVKPCGPYNVDDMAGFPEDVAADLVKQGLGEVVEVKAEKAKKESEKKEVQ